MVQAYPKGNWDKKYRRFVPSPSDDLLYAAKTPYGPPIKIHQQWYVGGHHDREGLFALWGSPVRNLGEVNKVPIEDIAPTLMMALEVPLPEDLPGQPHSEWFAEDFVVAHPVRPGSPARGSGECGGDRGARPARSGR